MKYRTMTAPAMLIAPVLFLALALAPLNVRAAAQQAADPAQKQAPAQPKQAASAAPAVLLQTNLGDIVVRLDAKKAPISTDNFLQYVRSGHYNGTIFHRVIKGFMIQGGGMDENLRAKPTRTPIRNEANNGLQNKKYTIAMARTNDPHSATSQFFINTKDNAFLNFKAQSDAGWGYAVFGKVIKGQDVVDKIEAQATGKRGFHDDVPKAAIVITKAEVVE